MRELKINLVDKLHLVVMQITALLPKNSVSKLQKYVFEGNVIANRLHFLLT